MTLDELEKEHEEKERKKAAAVRRYGSGAAGSSRGLLTREVASQQAEEWEDYMQYGFANLPRDFHGF